jgi:serine protease Do
MTLSFHGMARAGLGAAAGAVLMAAGPAAAEAEVSLPDLVDRVSPAVVTVLARQTNDSDGRRMRSPFEGTPFEEFFERFGPPGGANPFGGGPRMRQGLGSGFVLDADGYIVTNHHVVDGADDVTVRIAGEGEMPAEIVGTDEATDLALIRVESDGELPRVELGDSDAVRVGEDVIAVGNPFGLGGTVTRGIVSATGRSVGAGPYADFIQTDAAINRGNSGGPLFNMEGEVIGVNSSILSPNGGSVGVGFAVASNIVRDVVAELREQGVVSRGWLGVTIQRVTPEIATAIGLEDARGALVASVLDDGPSAGTLKSGDVILSFAGERVDSSRQLPKLVGSAEAGETVEMRVLRDGSEQTLSVTLGELDAERRASLGRGEDGEERSASETLGATLARITPEVRSNMGLSEEVSGVVVTSLDPRGAAARAGLRVGDVISRVGSEPVTSPGQVERALAAAEGDTALLQISRGGSRIFLGVRLA